MLSSRNGEHAELAEHAETLFSLRAQRGLRSRIFCLWLFGVAPTLLVSCTSPASPDGPVDASIVLAPGETKTVAGAAVALRFDGVLNDSRCPGDAICITGGDAIVKISVLENGGSEAAYELHTGNLQPARHNGLTIALAELSPYPFASRPFPPSDYRATLRVTR